MASPEPMTEMEQLLHNYILEGHIGSTNSPYRRWHYIHCP